MNRIIFSIFVLTILFFATGCQSDTNITAEIDKAMPVKSQHADIYTQDDLAKIYNSLRTKSFPDTPKDSRLLFEDLSPAFTMSHPLSFNMIIDIDGLNKHQWPEDAVKGLFAHELAHMVSFEKRSFFGRILLIWNYPFSASKRQAMEHEADQIAIDRGYGKELVQERIYQFTIDDVDHLEQQKQVYYWPETLKEMIAKKSE